MCVEGVVCVWCVCGVCVECVVCVVCGECVVCVWCVVCVCVCGVWCVCVWSVCGVCVCVVCVLYPTSHPPLYANMQLNLQGLENLDPSLVSASTKTILSYLKARLTNVSGNSGTRIGVGCHGNNSHMFKVHITSPPR